MTKYPKVGFRLSPALEKAINRESKRLGQNRSDLIRELICAALSARGAWPPPVRSRPDVVE